MHKKLTKHTFTGDGELASLHTLQELIKVVLILHRRRAGKNKKTYRRPSAFTFVVILVYMWRYKTTLLQWILCKELQKKLKHTLHTKKQWTQCMGISTHPNTKRYTLYRALNKPQHLRDSRQLWERRGMECGHQRSGRGSELGHVRPRLWLSLCLQRNLWLSHSGGHGKCIEQDVWYND